MGKLAIIAMSILLIFLFIAGCGETVSGVGKDAKRIGKGIKTIVFREE